MIKTILTILFLLGTQAFANINLQKGDVVLVSTGLTANSPYGTSIIWGHVMGTYMDSYSNITVEIRDFSGTAYTLPYQPYLFFKKSDEGGQTIILANESVEPITKYIPTYIGKDKSVKTKDLKKNEWKVLAIVQDQDPNSKKSRLVMINKENQIYFIDVSANTILGNAINGSEGSYNYYPNVTSEHLPSVSNQKCIEKICIGDQHFFAVSLDNELNKHQDFMGYQIKTVGDTSRTFDFYTGLGQVTGFYYSEKLELLYIRFIDADKQERVLPKSAILVKQETKSVTHEAGLVDPQSLLIKYNVGDEVAIQPYYAQKTYSGCKIESFNNYPFVDYMFGYEYYSSKALSKPFKQENNTIAELNCSGERTYTAIKTLLKKI